MTGRMAGNLVALACLFPVIASTSPLAADPFEDFFGNVEKGLNYMEGHSASDINGLLTSVQNTNFSHIIVMRLLREGNEDAEKLVRASDARVVELLATAEAAAKTANADAKKKRAISFLFQMVNLTLAVSDFLRSVEAATASDKTSMLEDAYGDDWDDLEDDFAEFIDSSPPINEEALEGTQELPAVPDEVPMTLGGAPTEKSKLEFIDDNLTWLEEHVPQDGKLDESTWEQAGERITETFRVLYSMSDTAADEFEQEYKLTFESTAGDLLPDSIDDANALNGLKKALEFYFRPQVVGDATPLGRGARLYKIERLNNFARLYLLRTNDLSDSFFNFEDGSLEIEIDDNLACAKSGCISIPQLPME